MTATSPVRTFIDMAVKAPFWQQAVAVFAVAVVATTAFTLTADAQTKAPAKPVPLLQDASKGPANAKVVVTEYASVTCTHCAAWYASNWAKFERDYVKTGKVKYVYREVATNPAPMAFGVYMLGHCAANKANWLGQKGGKKAYFTVIDGFLAAQSKVYETGDVLPVLKDLSKKSGLSEGEMDACVKNEALYKAVATRMEANMTKDDVESTPTFFVNGKRVPSDYASIEAAIKAASK
ncbi:thioredoxin domain-containing protein [Asticcacaulis sp. BYS171W]|uniref:Thioredoxin domain-containing protein n=1 Tax=Asticcacaulis aquaticus TaxID=2984212 RepID=A0ABT5HUP9_9CAUL|nr:thioredoxin domain-containing protein [Asticcacaulis aquaticus]MDC7683800.1 thioredoxin domain-containing protein [Asticcacaulis aquaticus]